MSESISFDPNINGVRLISQSAFATPKDKETEDTKDEGTAVQEDKTTAVAMDKKTVDPANIVTAVAQALQWNYAVCIEHDWTAKEELRFTVFFDCDKSQPLHSALADRIEEYFRYCADNGDEFRFSIDPNPNSGGALVRLSGKTQDGQNPQYWPSVTPGKHKTWIPDQQLAKQSGSADGWWLLEHTFGRLSLAQFACLVLEWRELDLRDRQAARLGAVIVRDADLSHDDANPRNQRLTCCSPVLINDSVSPCTPPQQPLHLSPAETLAGTIERLLAAMAPRAPLKLFGSIAVSGAFPMSIEFPALTESGPLKKLLCSKPILMTVLLDLTEKAKDAAAAMAKEVAAARRLQEASCRFTKLELLIQASFARENEPAVRQIETVSRSLDHFDVKLQIAIDAPEADEQWWDSSIAKENEDRATRAVH